MTETIRQMDTFSRWAQISGRLGVQLVRVTGGGESNIYSAVPLEFDGEGDLQTAEPRELTVTNLAEPPGQAGALPADTDAVALDVEGRWVIFVRQATSAVFLAKVVEALGSASYTVKEQVPDSEGGFTDRPGAAELPACNLAELDLGDGDAVDDDTLVLVSAATSGGSPPVVRYVFDHPVYAKYLE